MSFEFRFTSNISSTSIMFDLLPKVQLRLHNSHAERVIRFNFSFFLFGFTFAMQWYKSKYVNELRHEYQRLNEQLDPDTGVSI